MKAAPKIGPEPGIRAASMFRKRLTRSRSMTRVAPSTASRASAPRRLPKRSAASTVKA
jgi:hypothetical protein